MDIKAIQDLYDAATQAVTDTKYPEAIDLFADLIAQTSTEANQTPAIKTLRMNALGEYGRILRIMGNSEAAFAISKQYRDESDNDHHTVNALRQIAKILPEMGHYQRSIDTGQQAINLAQQINYTQGLGNAYATNGYTYLIWGKYEMALDHFLKAKELLQQSGNPIDRFNTHNYMGVAYHQNNELDKSIDSYLNALNIARQRQLYPYIIVALNNLGEAYQNLFDMEQALTHHQEALTLSQQYNIHRIDSDIHRNAGIELSYLGQYDKGIEHLQQALTISQAINKLDVKLHTLYALAYAELQRGNGNQARAYALELYELADKRETGHHQARALYSLGLYEKLQGENSVAEEMWQQAIFLAHEANERRLLWQIHADMARIASNKGLAQVHNRIAAEIIQQMALPIQNDELRQKFLSTPLIQTILKEANKTT